MYFGRWIKIKGPFSNKHFISANLIHITLCLGRPKALLPIGEKALISYWFEALDNLEAADTDLINEIIIVTNDKFNEQFYKSKKW